MHLCIKNESSLGLCLFPEKRYMSTFLTEKQRNDSTANTQQAIHGSVQPTAGTVLFYCPKLFQSFNTLYYDVY